MEIRDKVFVVTGGGNGIGREVTLELLRRGGRVAAVDLHDTGLAETASLAGANATGLSVHPSDITDRAGVGTLPAEVRARHGQVDGVVNVAGIIHRFAPLRDLSIEEIEHVMAVNFWGTVYVVRAFLPDLLARPAASLVNVSSIGGLVPAPGQGAYGASKAAVKLFTEALYAELRDSSVAVTAVYPGGVGTNIAGNSGVDLSGLGAAKDVPSNDESAQVTSPQDAGRQIVDAVSSGALRVLIGADARELDHLSRMEPQQAIDTVADAMQAMVS
ncbi:SDR family NAD(P)-dependent oxidoreductase [Streptomyces ardesiacus]|uniref:SDR family NAD(P)-dependent oxidoreductase n=1 Tax=Streptomyces ardesiacus TaxID=285564 RepID=UPI003F4A7EBE